MYRDCFIYLFILASICSADMLDPFLGAFQSSNIKSSQDSFTKKSLFPNDGLYDKLQGQWLPFHDARQKREAGFRDYDPCYRVFDCVEPYFNTPEPEGNIYNGIHFEIQHLEQMCRFARQYSDCFENANGLCTCGERTTKLATFAQAAYDNLCEQPWHPDALSFLQCANNHKVQLFLYGEINELSGMFRALDRLNSNSNATEELVCGKIRRRSNKILDRIGEECGMAVRDKLCRFSDNLLDFVVSAATSSLRCTFNDGC